MMLVLWDTNRKEKAELCLRWLENICMHNPCNIQVSHTHIKFDQRHILFIYSDSTLLAFMAWIYFSERGGDEPEIVK